MIAALVYVLCAVASALCAALLARGYLQSREPLLLWSTLCFVGLMLNNMLLVVDRVLLVEEVDLFRLRLVLALSGLGLLVYGLIWDADR